MPMYFLCAYKCVKRGHSWKLSIKNSKLPCENLIGRFCDKLSLNAGLRPMQRLLRDMHLSQLLPFPWKQEHQRLIIK